MTLELKIINEDATLNNFFDIGTQIFTPGNAFNIVCQFRHVDRVLRYMSAVGSTASLTLQNSDGTTLVKAGTFPLDPNDRSVVQFAITAGESALLFSQGLDIALTEGANVSNAISKSGIQVLQADC